MVELCEYNAQWPCAYIEESHFLTDILDQLDSIHHIGSTSIPGMLAKPTIDVLCVVKNLRNSLKLVDHGYVFKGEINVPMRYYFSKNTKVAFPINLHVVESGNGFIKLNLCFRDYIRSNEYAFFEYKNLKSRLLKMPSSHVKQDGRFTGYNLGKNTFIKKVLKEAGFDGFHANFCMHDEEYVSYKNIYIQHCKKHDACNINSHCRDSNHRHIVFYKGIEIIGICFLEKTNCDVKIQYSMFLSNKDDIDVFLTKYLDQNFL